MTNSTITLGIPTFRRPEALMGLLTHVKDTKGLRDNVKVLVVDDSGTEQYWDKYDDLINYYSSEFDSGKFTYIKNNENLGFARNLAKLIELTETDYLLVMADDDLIVEDDFLRILEFIETKRPDILSPRWVSQKGRIGRGGGETRLITLEEHRLCCGHVPGLFFNVGKVRDVLPYLYARVESGCSAALTYPSVILSIALLMKRTNIWYFDGVIAKENGALPSQIKDASGNHYADMASRIQQIASFDQYILSFPASEARDRMLHASRGWAICKACGADATLSKYVYEHIKPRSPIERVIGRLKRYTERFLQFASS